MTSMTHVGKDQQPEGKPPNDCKNEHKHATSRQVELPALESCLFNGVVLYKILCTGKDDVSGTHEQLYEHSVEHQPRG